MDNFHALTITKPNSSIDTDKTAASLPSPQASRQDELFSKTQADFGHGLPSDLSSPFSDFDTTHSQRDPVQPHFTELRADMVDLCLRPRFGNLAAGETVASHHNDNSSSDPEDGELDPIINPLIEAANNPPPFRDPESWKDVPASYVPRHWPTGPRKLGPGRYICPFEGCKHPVGPTESGEGYSRTTLGPHIRTHDNYSWGGRFGLRSTMRTRVMALRNPQRRDLYGPAGVVIDLSRNDSDPLRILGDPVQEETDALIPYLEEIKNFEQSNVLRNPTIIDRKLRLYFRGDEKLERLEIEEEVDGESVPKQSSSRSRSYSS